MSDLLPRRRRLAHTAVVALAAMLLATACGSADHPTDDTAGTPSSAQNDGGQDSTQNQDPQPAPAVSPTEYAFTYTEESGIEVDGVLRLANVMPGDDPNLAPSWKQLAPSAPETVACVSDGARDGVIPGSIEFTNPSPDYAPSGFEIVLSNRNFRTFDPAKVSYEIDYSDEPGDCDESGEGAVRPNLEGVAKWGPIPLAITVHDLYGPNGPDANVASQAADMGISGTTAMAGRFHGGSGLQETGGYGGQDQLTFQMPMS